MVKFQMPLMPPTVNKSVRISNDLICAVYKAIYGLDCTFSLITNEAVRVALENVRLYGIEIKSEAPSMSPKTNKTFRMPNTYIIGIQKAIEGTNCTVSGFIAASLRRALKDLEEEQPK